MGLFNFIYWKRLFESREWTRSIHTGRRNGSNSNYRKQRMCLSLGHNSHAPFVLSYPFSEVTLSRDVGVTVCLGNECTKFEFLEWLKSGFIDLSLGLFVCLRFDFRLFHFNGSYFWAFYVQQRIEMKGVRPTTGLCGHEQPIGAEVRTICS